jgi:hypothetical protein
LTPIIETAEGFYVAKVRRRTRAWRIPFARIQRELRQDIERERHDEARRAVSKQLRRDARVRVSPAAIAAFVSPREPEVIASDLAHPPGPPGFSEDS